MTYYYYSPAATEFCLVEFPLAGASSSKKAVRMDSLYVESRKTQLQANACTRTVRPLCAASPCARHVTPAAALP
eukprot:COSAG01_NODE_545_length_15679_cov_68.030167_15_plen_73_part_01